MMYHYAARLSINHLELKMKLNIEIRPGEGGEDAKLLVKTQAAAYCRYAERNGVRVAVEESGSRL